MDEEKQNQIPEPPPRMNTDTMDPELRKKETKMKFKIIFLSQIIQMVETREKKVQDPTTSKEMMEYIDSEIKELFKKIFPIDEVESRFQGMLDAIKEQKEKDSNFEVKHPLELTLPFPTPEKEQELAQMTADRIKKESENRAKIYIPQAALNHHLAQREKIPPPAELISQFGLQCSQPDKCAIEYVHNLKDKNGKYNITAVPGMANALEIDEKIKIDLIQSDIVVCSADAIVTTNNATLQDNQGLTQSLFSQGGNVAQKECEEWIKVLDPSLDGKIPVGGCAVTSAGSLKAKYIIHSRGPKYDDLPDEDENKTRTMKNSMRMAMYTSLDTALRLKCETLALSPISGEHYKFPAELQAKYMISNIIEWASVADAGQLNKITIFVADPNDYQTFRKEFEEILGKMQGSQP